jgi:hypothetical protein
LLVSGLLLYNVACVSGLLLYNVACVSRDTSNTITTIQRHK